MYITQVKVRLTNHSTLYINDPLFKGFSEGQSTLFLLPEWMTGQAMPNYTEDPMLINFPSSNDTDLLVLKPMVVNLGKDLFRNGRNTQFALIPMEGGLKKPHIFLKTKYILANLFKNTLLSMVNLRAWSFLKI